MMFPPKKAKVLISFHFDLNVFSKWPCSVASIQYGVEIAYGSIEWVLFCIFSLVLLRPRP